MLYQMWVESYHQDRVDRVPIAERLKNQPVSQCSSNALSVASKESAALSNKYQYFLTLPSLAIAVSVLLTLYRYISSSLATITFFLQAALGQWVDVFEEVLKSKNCTQAALGQWVDVFEEVLKSKICTRPELTQITKREVRQALHLTRPR